MFQKCADAQGIVPYEQTEIRVAIDIGSSKTKVVIASVTNEKITQVFFSDIYAIPFQIDLATSENHCLSEMIEKELIKTIQEIQSKVEQFYSVKWAAVGTSAIRTAANGKEFLKHIKDATGLEIQMISQDVEGTVGFNGAVAASFNDPENVIAWDVGTGSFQISTLNDGHIIVYGAEYGNLACVQELFKIREKKLSTDINPLSLEEANQVHGAILEKLPPIEPWVLNKDKKMIGFGDKESIFAIGSQATGNVTFTKKQVMSALSENFGKIDAELMAYPKPHKVVIGLVLLNAFMDHCQIEEATYAMTSGVCEGMLITPSLWE